MTYDALPYWRARGETFAAQEAAFVRLVSGLEFASVLDVGCGPARLGTLLRGLRPGIDYTGIDVSSAVLRMAEVRLPDATFHRTSLAAFRPSRQWDLVLASELLMHVTPAALDDAVASLVRWSSRWIVTIDWTAPVDGVASHNFLHDYRASFARSGLRLIDARRVGLQTIHRLAAA